jgi:hypothetical protein
MKPVKLFALSPILLLAAFGVTAFINTKLLNKVNTDDKGFAVVELYTSEGCSSCPPADQLIAKIQKEDADKPVYILAFHVDYWDRLGWKDAFSDAGYSRRQQDYASYLHIQSVYTPQAIVNGQTEFVGSEESALRKAIDVGLAKKPSADLTLKMSAPVSGKTILNYTDSGATKDAELLIAVLQKNAQTKVVRGENQGRTLNHVQIVRELQRVNFNGESGSVTVKLPNGFDKAGWEIIGMLQNTKNGGIIAAAKVTSD